MNVLSTIGFYSNENFHLPHIFFSLIKYMHGYNEYLSAFPLWKDFTSERYNTTQINF